MSPTSPLRPRRRRLLGAGLATGLTLGAAGLLSGCAGAPRGASIGRVVVVGGGFGGATAAHYLKRWGSNIDVTLVERDAAFVSCPLSNLVIAGELEMDDITRRYDGLRALGVRVVQGEVVAIDPAARRVRLAAGDTLAYDRLVLSPGIDFITGEVAGLDTPAARERVLHGWKAGVQTLALRRQLNALRDGGVVVLTVPRAPYRCPPGPYERACLIAAHLQRHKPRAKLLVLDANPEITSKKGLFEAAFKDRYAGVLEYRPNAVLTGVDAGAGLARFEFESIRADLINVVPAQRAADIARSAGLANVNSRWVGVNWLTLESTAAPGVHVLGDATFPAPAMPKSGHMANQHAKVAAAAIVQLLRGEPVNPDPLVMNTCYSFVSASDAMHVASVHRWEPAESTFKPVAGAGGLSALASAAEGRFARSWAENIWSDLLAGPPPR